MFTALFWIMVVVALLNWFAAWRRQRRLYGVTKPAVLILLIAWFTQIGGWQGSLLWFGLGLVFSLAGDVLLLFPERFFLPGLGAFLITHLFYILGFWQQPVVLTWAAVLPVILVGLVFWALTSRIRAGLSLHRQNNMTVPVMVYSAVISLMWLSALLTLLRPGWLLLPAILVSVGAALFVLSDGMLAYNRFVRPISAADLLVISTYHTGQILITTGVLLNFMR